MNKVMQSNPLILNDPMTSSALNENSAIIDLTNKELISSVYSYLKVSAEAITGTFNLTPIMYDDGNYSYSSLNLIHINRNTDWFIAPFELIESVPAGK